jgi:NAD+-dependent farnesol dehydrogenase
MKVLVTGGTGYLGRAIVAALAARGHELVVFSRQASRSGLPGTLIDGDVRDRAAIDQAIRGCDAVSHSAALVSIWRRRRADFDEVNVGGLANIVAAASQAGVKRVVYTSSFLALPPVGASAPLEANDYQRTKVAADRLAQRLAGEGHPIVRVYPGVIYGPGALTEGNLIGRLIADHLRRKLPGLVGGGIAPWSCAYVVDVAGGIAAAVERGVPGSRVLLGGDNAPPRRIFEMVRQLTGRSLPLTIPYAAAAAIGAAEELRVRLFGGVPLLTRGTVEILKQDWSLDSRAAVRDLGYAMTPLDEGVRRTVESLRQV